jgi:hypothetical protein
MHWYKRWPIAPEERKAYGVSPSRGAAHHRAVSGPPTSVVLRASVLEALPETRTLRGRTFRHESPDNEPRLPTQGGRAGPRSEARVRAKPAPGVHHEVDVPFYGGIDLVDIPGVHCPALVHGTRDRRRAAVEVTPFGSYLRLGAVEAARAHVQQITTTGTP